MASTGLLRAGVRDVDGRVARGFTRERERRCICKLLLEQDRTKAMRVARGEERWRDALGWIVEGGGDAGVDERFVARGCSMRMRGCVNAVTGVFFKLVEHQREDGRVERGREYLREPVKFPGWSQPGVSGLQA